MTATIKTDGPGPLLSRLLSCFLSLLRPLGLLLLAPLPGAAQPQVDVLVLVQTQQQQQSGEGKLYTPGSFERLEISGSANVKLLQGDRDQIFIHGDEEVQQGAQIELHNGRLTLRSTEGWKLWRSRRLEVEVMMRKLSQLSLSGAGDVHAPGPIQAGRLAISISGAGLVRCDDLNAEQLEFTISGAGEGQMRGQVNDLSLRISGKGKLLAEPLHVQRARVSISGIGGAELWVSEDLKVGISGIGSVDYWGRPQLQRTSSGLATINARGEKRAPPGRPAGGNL